MRIALYALLALACGPAASAAPLPVYPVDANCREATDFFYRGSHLAPERKAFFERECVRLQQDAHDAVAALWPVLEAKDQDACLRLVRTDNYILLERCAADLRTQELGAREGGGAKFHP